MLTSEELQRLEEVRQALVRFSSSAAAAAEGNEEGEEDDDEHARIARALLRQARRCAATLSRGGGEGGMAGQVAKLVVLQALVSRLSPLPSLSGGGDSGGAVSSSSSSVWEALAGKESTGRELRRVLVPPLLDVCRGGGEGMAVRLEAARALGALGAVPPWEVMLWDPYDPTAETEDAGGGGGGAGHGGTQGRTRGRGKGQEAVQQAPTALPPIQVRLHRVIGHA